MQYPPTRRLGRPLCARYFSPTLESLPHLYAVCRRGQQMPSRSEVVGNGTIRGQKALSMTRRLQPLHTILTLTRGTMGMLTPVVQRATLAVFDPGQDLPFGRAVALQLIRDDHPWHVLQPLEQLAKELLRRVLIAPALDQNVEDVVVLVDSAPQVMAFAMNRQNSPLLSSAGCVSGLRVLERRDRMGDQCVLCGAVAVTPVYRAFDEKWCAHPRVPLGIPSQSPRSRDIVGVGQGIYRPFALECHCVWT